MRQSILARLEKVSQAGEAHVAVEAARRIVSMMPGASGPEETDWSEARLRILPRLVSQSFLGTIPHEEGLFRQALGHDVHITLQLRYGTRARYVRRAEVEHWGLGEGAIGHAVLNLAERTRELRVEPVEDGLLRVRQGDGLDGSRLILPDLAARLQTLGGGDWLAAAPHRDVLLLARAEQLPTLAARAQDASERAPHPISAAVFAVRENQLRPVTA